MIPVKGDTCVLLGVKGLITLESFYAHLYIDLRGRAKYFTENYKTIRVFIIKIEISIFLPYSLQKSIIKVTDFKVNFSYRY